MGLNIAKKNQRNGGKFFLGDLPFTIGNDCKKGLQIFTNIKKIYSISFDIVTTIYDKLSLVLFQAARIL